MVHNCLKFDQSVLLVACIGIGSKSRYVAMYTEKHANDIKTLHMHGVVFSLLLVSSAETPCDQPTILSCSSVYTHV